MTPNLRLTMQLSILELIGNTPQVVAEHLDADEYPIRVRLTRALTEHERELVQAHPGWTLPQRADEITVFGRLDTLDEAQIGLLIRELKQVQDQGRVLDDEDDERRERERLEHIAQTDKINKLNSFIDRHRYQ